MATATAPQLRSKFVYPRMRTPYGSGDSGGDGALYRDHYRHRYSEPIYPYGTDKSSPDFVLRIRK